MQQYFVDTLLEEGKEIALNAEISHHLIRVLRKKSGERIRLVDKEANLFLAEIVLEGKKVYAICIEKLEEEREAHVDVTLLLSLFKRDKWELALQKATELGVSRIIPVRCARSVVTKSYNLEKRRERLEKILMEAAEQSERLRVPKLFDEISFEECGAFQSELNVICYARDEGDVFFADLLSANRDVGSVSILVGPEGGFEDREVRKAQDFGFQTVRLGERILRAETAAMLAVGLTTNILRRRHE